MRMHLQGFTILLGPSSKSFYIQLRKLSYMLMSRHICLAVFNWGIEFCRLDASRRTNVLDHVPQMSGSQVKHGKAQGRTGVSSYFQRQQLALTSSHWQVIQFYSSVYLECDLGVIHVGSSSCCSLKQIIQLVPSSQHGQLFAWVVAEGVMHKIPIMVPRVFYLKYKASVTEDFPGKSVSKVIPHGCHSNLIEVHRSSTKWLGPNAEV